MSLRVFSAKYAASAKGLDAPFGHIETPGATVHRIPVTLDPTCVLQTIYVAAKRDILNFKNVR